MNGESHFANASDPVLPKSLEGLVESISGLHDFHLRPQHLRPVANITTPDFTASGGNHFLTPDDFATIYDVKPLYAAGMDGTGQKIAIVGESDINLADIQAFRSAAGLPQRNPVVVLTGPDPGIHAGPATEADLDLEWAGGIARNATIIYVNSTDVGLSTKRRWICTINLAKQHVPPGQRAGRNHTRFLRGRGRGWMRGT